MEPLNNFNNAHPKFQTNDTLGPLPKALHKYFLSFVDLKTLRNFATTNSTQRNLIKKLYIEKFNKEYPSTKKVLGFKNLNTFVKFLGPLQKELCVIAFDQFHTLFLEKCFKNLPNLIQISLNGCDTTVLQRTSNKSFFNSLKEKILKTNIFSPFNKRVENCFLKFFCERVPQLENLELLKSKIDCKDFKFLENLKNLIKLVIEDPQIIGEHIDLSHLKIKTLSIRLKFDFHKIIIYPKSLTNLTICNISQNYEFLKSLPNLKELTFIHSKNTSNVSLPENLEMLTIHWCYENKYEFLNKSHALKNFIIKKSSITELNLPDTENCEIEDLSGIVSINAMNTRIKKLKIDDCRNAETLTLPNSLEYCHINFLNKLTNIQCDDINKLTTLKIKRCIMLKELNFVSNLINLSILSLNIRLPAKMNMEFLGNLKRLKKLSLGLSYIKNRLRFNTDPIESLEELKLDNIVQSKDYDDINLEKIFPNLIKLTILHSPLINKIEGLKKLYFLKVSHSDLVISKDLPKLETLNLTNCPNAGSIFALIPSLRFYTLDNQFMVL